MYIQRSHCVSAYNPSVQFSYSRDPRVEFAAFWSFAHPLTTGQWLWLAISFGLMFTDMWCCLFLMLSEQRNLYSPKSQSHRLNGLHSLYSERHPLCLDWSEEKLEWKCKKDLFKKVKKKKKKKKPQEEPHRRDPSPMTDRYATEHNTTSTSGADYHS